MKMIILFGTSKRVKSLCRKNKTWKNHFIMFLRYNYLNSVFVVFAHGQLADRKEAITWDACAYVWRNSCGCCRICVVLSSLLGLLRRRNKWWPLPNAPREIGCFWCCWTFSMLSLFQWVLNEDTKTIDNFVLTKGERIIKSITMELMDYL